MFKLKVRNVLISILLLLPLLITPAYAAKIESDDYTLSKDAIIEDDLYVNGEFVTISGIVDGDLIIVGNNILVDGTVTGDLYAFGENIRVTGTISGLACTLGSNVNISGTVRDNVYLAAAIGDIRGNIDGDVFAATGQLNLEGTITDDVRAVTGQLNSTATVGGDFLLAGDNYTLERNDISGQFLTSTKDIEEKEQLTSEDFFGINLGFTLATFVGMYIVGVLLILSAPVKTLQIEKKITTSWMELLKSYGVGILIIIAIPIPIFLLLISIIGLPIAFLIMAVLLFLSTFGTVWAESAIGNKVLKLAKGKDTGRFFSLLIGRSITTVVRLIPILRGVYNISLIAITVGSITRMKYDGFMEAKKVSKKK